MFKYHMHVLKVIKYFDYLDIEAESEEEAIQKVKDGDYKHEHDWKKTDTIDLEVKVFTHE